MEDVLKSQLTIKRSVHDKTDFAYGGLITGRRAT